MLRRFTAIATAVSPPTAKLRRWARLPVSTYQPLPVVVGLTSSASVSTYSNVGLSVLRGQRAAWSEAWWEQIRQAARVGAAVAVATTLFSSWYDEPVATPQVRAWEAWKVFAEARPPAPRMADMIAKARPSVVKITGSGPEISIFGWTPDQSDLHPTQLGTGFFVREDGLIATNAHVCAELTHPKVTLADGRVFDASLLGLDAQSDVAVLKLEGTKGEKFQPIALGESSQLRVGDTVVALGHPLGLRFAATSGIISCTTAQPGDNQLFERYTAGNRSRESLGRVSGMLQTDAVFAPGNSGGPLLNEYGEVVGIATLVMGMQAPGISFGLHMAIPIDAALPIIQHIADQGYVSRNYLGMIVVELTANVIKNQQKADPSFTAVPGQGLLVVGIDPKSPALKAGIRPGDILQTLDGKPVSTLAELYSALGVYEDGRVLAAEVNHHGHGQLQTFSIRPVEIPPPVRPPRADERY